MSSLRWMLCLAALALAVPAFAAQKLGQGCSAFETCGDGLSCHPFIQKCFHSPRRLGEPCVAGHGCGPGLTCLAGKHVCVGPGKLGDSCHATKPCGAGLSCAPGVHRCYHEVRREGEPCSAGFPCDPVLDCVPVKHVCKRPHVPKVRQARRGEEGFYVIAHMANNADSIDWAVARGANAIEADIQFDHQTGALTEFRHGGVCDCACNLPLSGNVCSPLRMSCEASEAAAAHLRKLASKKSLALVILDSKVPADGNAFHAEAAGRAVIAAIDAHLYGRGAKFRGKVIVSHGTHSELGKRYLKSAAAASTSASIRTPTWRSRRRWSRSGRPTSPWAPASAPARPPTTCPR